MKIAKKIQELLKGLIGSYKEQSPKDPPDKDFVPLCENLAELVQMYDRMQPQLQSQESKDLVDDFNNQIIRSLHISGKCKVLGLEKEFNSRLHVPVPFSLVEDGTPIESVVRIGIAIDDIVLIPAKVKIRE